MKRGQVTLFVIFALIVVVSVVVGLVFLKAPRLKRVNAVGISEQIRGCVEKIVEKNAFELLEKGGVLRSNFCILYDGENYTYLCYSEGFQGCYNLYPDIFEVAKKDLIERTEEGVGGCFESMKEDLEEKGYSVSVGAINYDIEILPENIKIILKSKVSVKKGDLGVFVDTFNTRVNVDIYEFLDAATRIVNSEAENCYFNVQRFMMLYPELEIVQRAYEGSKVYRIKNRKTGNELKFAVRGCRWE